MSRRIQTWRWFVKIMQVVLIVGLPFLRIRGESVLRFDVPSLTLHFFGARVWMDEFFLVLIAVLFLSFLVLFLTVLFGRVWCGWLCPQTVISDFTYFVDRVPFRGAAYRIGAVASVLTVSALVSASLIWYFVPPYEFLGRLAGGSVGPVIGWSWGSLAVILFLNFFFLRHRFCATVCPYAKMQGALYDDHTLIIASDPARMDECMHCDACVNVCPVRIDVRKGVQSACINCAECVDACSRQMERRSRISLIGYRFGEVAHRSGFFRGSVVLTGIAAAFFLSLLLLATGERSPLDLDIAADPSSTPRKTAAGTVVNAYLLSLSNRTAQDQEVVVRAAGQDGPFGVMPDRIRLEKGAHVRRSILVQGPSTSVPIALAVSVELLSDLRVRLERRTTFSPPW